MEPYSIYLHIPFCTHRCGYCDFNTFAGQETLIPDYTTALCTELRQVAQNAPMRLPVHTVFFGGGTPSLLSLNQINRILDELSLWYDLLPGAEITLEANPGTLSLDYLISLHAAGVNRLSLGVQSANPSELRILERIHNFPEAIQCVAWARKAGFGQINLDLIYGLPEQELKTWQNTLRLTAGLHPDHLSLYALSLEHGTPFGHWAARGILSTPDPDRAADMYEWASDWLGSAGYSQYEISNWAKALPGDMISGASTPALACQHNLQYWRNLPYLGFGAGAHGYAADVRTANVQAPATYIKRLREKDRHDLIFPSSQATQNLLSIDLHTEIGETMMMGLRLTREGVRETTFENRFQKSLSQIFAEPIQRLINWSLLEWIPDPAGRILRLTPHGRLLGNRVFAEFI